jgi:hypothetical protein
MTDSWFIWGLDLGKRRDYAALTACKVTLGADPTWRPGKYFQPDGQPTPAPLVNYYGCVHVQRWPLGTTYPALVDNVREVLTVAPGEKMLAVDGNAIGEAVMDMLILSDLPCPVRAIKTTGGHRVSVLPDGIHVPKVDVMDCLKTLFAWKRLVISKGMLEASALVKELQEFQEKLTKSNNRTMEARAGSHDDIISALANSLWYAEHAPPQADGPLVLNAPWPPPNLPKEIDPTLAAIPGTPDWLRAHGVDIDVDAEWGEDKPWWER